jgi:hypothetical protein
MNYNGKFGFYDPKTKQAQVYDGSKSDQVLNAKSGVMGVFIPTIFDGECTKNEFEKMIGEKEND